MPTESDFDHMDDSERMPLDRDRRVSHNRRRIIRMIPDFSAGTVALIMTIVGALIASEVRNSQRDERILVLQTDRERDRVQMNATLQDIRMEIRETRTAVSSTKEDVAAVKAQLGVMQTNQQDKKR